jgi:hypothetical protein
MPSQIEVDLGYLATVEEIAPELSMSAWTLGEACRRLEFPHVKLPHRRRILIDRRHVAAFLDGAPLEAKRLPGGGRVVKPTRART